MPLDFQEDANKHLIWLNLVVSKYNDGYWRRFCELKPTEVLSESTFVGLDRAAISIGEGDGCHAIKRKSFPWTKVGNIIFWWLPRTLPIITST